METLPNSKPKFVRKTDKTNLLKEDSKSYDNFIVVIFRALKLEVSTDRKIELIKEDYYKICSRDVIKNELFINRLKALGTDIQLSKPGLKSSFLATLKLLNKAQILDSSTFKELKQEFGFPDDPNSHTSQQNTYQDIVQAQKFINHLLARKVDPDHRKVKNEYVKQVLEELRKIEFSRLDPSTDLNVEFEHNGSYVNGFALLSSDYDVSIITLEPVDERKFLNFFYEEAREILEKKFGNTEIEISKLTNEFIRVPLVNIRLKKNDIRIDFCVNNQLGIHNSNLLKTYASFDTRCHTLGLLVKIWAKTHKVIGAQKKFLSSYALSLLVINFLQSMEQPILPNLQDLGQKSKEIRVTRTVRDKFQDFMVRIDFEEDPEKLEEIKQNMNANKMTSDVLLKKFFKFYSQVNKYENMTVSVKNGRLVPRKEEEMDLLISIEDPFDRHNPGSSLKKNSTQASTFIQKMKESYRLLRDNKIKEVFKPF